MLTHDPKLDDAALTLALRSGAGYIGAMGSRRAQADRRARLLEAGMTDGGDRAHQGADRPRPRRPERGGDGAVDHGRGRGRPPRPRRRDALGLGRAHPRGAHLIVGLVLAAGAGRRFGGTKQLADLDGRPLLQYALDAANAEPALDRVVLVLGHEAERIRAAVDLGRAEVTLAPGWNEGQAASLRAGVQAARDGEAIVVLLGDQPHPVPGAVDRVLAARGEHPAVRARYGGKPGHPVVLEHALFGDLLRLRGDQGARDLLAQHAVTEVEMDAEQDDVDTPEQLERMRR